MNSNAHPVYTTLIFGNLREFANFRIFYNKRSSYFTLLYLSHYKLRIENLRFLMISILNIK